MEILKIDPADHRLVNSFLELPARIYRDVPQWVPPLAIEARRLLDLRRNPFYQHGEAAFFLAFDPHSEPVGRLAALVDHNYNQYNAEKTGFFYLFECQNNLSLSASLFQSAFSWAQAHGLHRLVGPRGFTVMDGMGLLVKGFEHRPALGLPYHLPIYQNLVEASGFVAMTDLVSGYMNASAAFSAGIHSLAEKLIQRRGLRIARFRTRRDLRALVPRLKDLYNRSLAGTSGNTPLTDEDARAMANQMLWFADPRLIKIVMKGDEMVGFLFAYPDISAAIQRVGGRLFPFGWIDILLELRRTKWVNINGAGMVEGYRGLGGTALLFSEMYKSVHEGGYHHADIVQIGTDNERMQRELRGLGIDFYKTHRLYQRNLLETGQTRLK